MGIGNLSETAQQSTASDKSVQIRVSNLSKRFLGRKDESDVLAVADMEFTVEKGAIVALLGPSGCGKTTTLRCIAGLEQPDTGDIWIGSREVFSSSRGVDLTPERRELGMVFQTYALWPHMSVQKNVAYPLAMRGLQRSEIEEKTRQVLQLVRCEALAERLPGQLSGGQQQRVALARALVAEPDILLFDEPLSNLDARLRERMRFEILDLHQRLGFTGIYVTHDQLEAMTVSDEIILMNDGRIVQTGDPASVYRIPKSRFVADFMGTTNVVDATVAELNNNAVTSVVNDSMGTIHVAGLAVTASPGDTVEVSIRPESFTLSRTPVAGANQWRGGVERRIDLGTYVAYVVNIGGQRIRVHTNQESFNPGHEVHITVESDACFVFLAAAEDNGALSG